MMPMVSVWIGGVDRSADVVLSSLRITAVLSREVASCSFELRLRDPGAKPVAGQAVLVEDSTEGVVFAGRIVTAEERERAQGNLGYLVTCTDHTREADSRLVVEHYPAGRTRGAIALDIVTRYCPPGFTAPPETVADGPKLPAKRFDYKRPSECFSELARETGGEWYWDFDRRLHLFGVGAEEMSAPFDIADGGEHPADLVIAPDIADLTTRVYVLGGDYFGDPLTQSFLGDGVQREFTLAYKPKDLVVTLDGAPQVVAVDDLLNQPDDPDWTWNFQEKLLKRGAGRGAPAAGTLVVATYRPQLPVRVVMDDSAAQARLGAIIGNDGVFEASMVDHSLDSREAARLAATAYLAEHANPLIHGGYSTLRPGLRPGMRQRIRLASRGVDLEVLLGQVVRQALPGGVVGWRYSVSFATKLAGIEDLIRQLVEAQKRTAPRDDETLDIILGLRDVTPAVDAVAVSETGAFVAVVDLSRVGFCEVGE
jgi:hypothetical protein